MFSSSFYKYLSIRSSSQSNAPQTPIIWNFDFRAVTDPTCPKKALQLSSTELRVGSVSMCVHVVLWLFRVEMDSKMKDKIAPYCGKAFPVKDVWVVLCKEIFICLTQREAVSHIFNVLLMHTSVGQLHSNIYATWHLLPLQKEAVEDSL